MSADLTRGALVRSVQLAWGQAGFGRTPARDRLAEVAVDDLVSALRANPLWAESLGIGGTSREGEKMGPSRAGAIRTATRPSFYVDEGQLF